MSDFVGKIATEIDILPSSAQAQAPAGLSIALIPSSTPTRHPPPEIGHIQARTQPIGTSIDQVNQFNLFHLFK